MKKKKRHVKSEAVINNLPGIKMSELIAKFASDYINMGETTKERQSYLNGACTAWNIAVLPDSLREMALRHHIEEYQKFNPGIDDADNVIHDMKILIQKKLRSCLESLDSNLGGPSKYPGHRRVSNIPGMEEKKLLFEDTVNRPFFSRRPILVILWGGPRIGRYKFDCGKICFIP